MLAYLLYRLAGAVVPLVPRRVGYALMGVVAALAYRLNAHNRRMIECNVRRVLGPSASDTDVKRVVKRIYHNLLKNYFDLFWLPAQSEATMAKLLTVHGMENVYDALTTGKGVILVSVHMGNQEVMTQVSTVTDLQLTLIVEHIANERVFQYITSLRAHSGIRLVPQDGALRELFRALKRNELIGLVFDRDVTKSGRTIPFFGEPTRLPDGYAVLSLKLGCPIVPGFALRQPDGTYVAYIEKPIRFSGRADNDDDVKRLMAAVGQVAEQYVARYTDQWVYFHHVWEQDEDEKGRTHSA